MPKNLGLYNNDLSVPRKKDIDDLANVVDGKYSSTNPPPYPVTSVNGQTGAVTVEADIPDNLVKYTPLSDVASVPTVDADTLQGHSAAYFATQTALGGVESNVTTNATNISVLQTTVNNLQSNKLDKFGGTMTGALVAQTNSNYTTRQVRNVIISTANPSGGSDGDIWIRYTP